MNNSMLLSSASVALMMVFSWQVDAADGRYLDVEIVVSPTGSDAASGSAQKPVATLQQAQLLARTALASGQRVRVTLTGGVYRLERTLAFSQEDSGTDEAPVVWQASAGQQVTISGGTLLELQWKPYRDRIFKAQVPADFVSDQLYVNGVPQHLARYPNYDPGQRIMNGFAADCISPERTARWADPTGGYKEGQEIRVEAQSNCKDVELFLNGESLGRQAMQPNSKLVWQVKYEPGTLSVKVSTAHAKSSPKPRSKPPVLPHGSSSHPIAASSSRTARMWLCSR